MTDDEKQRRIVFIDTLNANVDNAKLSDAEFREFVRNSMVLFTFGEPQYRYLGLDEPFELGDEAMEHGGTTWFSIIDSIGETLNTKRGKPWVMARRKI